MDGPGHSFFEEIQAGLATKGRRGEVVMLIRHRDGRLWLHRKRQYPPGAYRLLSGGIQRDEPALAAAQRECWEETGIRAEPAACLGILRYRLQRAGATLRFISYFFLIEGGDAEPAPQDLGEQICSFQRVAPADLSLVAVRLREVPPDWQDWGQFRALGHEFVAEQWEVKREA